MAMSRVSWFNSPNYGGRVPLLDGSGGVVRREDGRPVFVIQGGSEDAGGGGDGGAGKEGAAGAAGADGKPTESGAAGKPGEGGTSGQPNGGAATGQSPEQIEHARLLSLTPEQLTAEVIKAREGQSKLRINAKEQAAADAKAELAKSILATLGIKAQDDLTPEDARALIAKEKTRGDDNERLLAAYMSAGAEKINAAALLNVYDFRESLAKIEPSDRAGILALVKQTATSQPHLKLAGTTGQASGSSSASHAGGSGEGRTLTAADAAPGESRIAAAYADSQ